jgi:aspartyl protease family protein
MKSMWWHMTEYSLGGRMDRKTLTGSLCKQFARMPLLWGFLAMIFFAAPAYAVEEIEVIALFTGKVIVTIDGQRRVIAEGDITEEGVEGIRINSNRAILKVDGEERVYTLNNRIGGPYATKEKKRVDVFRLDGQNYVTSGSINGVPVRFIVDTGASKVAISASKARQLGLDYESKGKPIQVNTASHIWPGYAVTFDRVKVGEIEMRLVEGIVIEGNKPDVPLLGMSFLNKLTVTKEGEVMRLEY